MNEFPLIAVLLAVNHSNCAKLHERVRLQTAKPQGTSLGTVQSGLLSQVFYASGMSASVPAATRVNTNAIQQLFNRYADPTDGVILADGVGRFCDDLAVRACPFTVQPFHHVQWQCWGNQQLTRREGK